MGCGHQAPLAHRFPGKNAEVKVAISFSRGGSTIYHYKIKNFLKKCCLDAEILTFLFEQPYGIAYERIQIPRLTGGVGLIPVHPEGEALEWSICTRPPCSLDSETLLSNT